MRKPLRQRLYLAWIVCVIRDGGSIRAPLRNCRSIHAKEKCCIFNISQECHSDGQLLKLSFINGKSACRRNLISLTASAHNNVILHDRLMASDLQGDFLLGGAPGGLVDAVYAGGSQTT